MDKKLNNSQEYPAVNRQYKDRLFRLVFSKKEDLLSLYNAINGTDYTNPDDLEITTLENALYLSMKNDLGFLVSVVLNLYEHQSTFNPNMPTRALLYFARMYEDHIAKHNINIYSSAPKKLPFPQHIVFYNGTKNEPDRQLLKLSHLFETPPAGMEPCLECTSLMLNINYGHNNELLEKCRRLKEYAIFVDTVRRNLDSGLPLPQAASLSVDECIQNDILADILTSQKAEVIHVILETFDLEKYEKAVKREGFDEGYDKGLNAERKNGIRQLISALREMQADHPISDEEITQKLMSKYSLTLEETENFLKQYGK